MKGSVMIDLFLGFMRALFGYREDDHIVGYIDKIISLKRAGGNVDAHMRTVADFMLGGEEPDFAGLSDRIDTEVDKLTIGYVPDPEKPPGGGGDSGGGGTPPSGDGALGDDYEP